MSALNTLKLVSAKRPQTAAPIVLRRNKLSNQLHEQIELARCQADGKTYAPTRVRSIKDGNRPRMLERGLRGALIGGKERFLGASAC